MRKVIEKLSWSLGERGEAANVELGKKIAAENDSQAAAELAGVMMGPDKHLRADALKALYEAGYENPGLIAPFADQFLALLKDKNNRMVWGAMCALGEVVKADAEKINKNLAAILETMKGESVIARDHGMKILVELSSKPSRRGKMLDLLLETLAAAPDNQFPTYAELILPVLDEAHTPTYCALLRKRQKELAQPAKVKRIEKLLNKLKD